MAPAAIVRPNALQIIKRWGWVVAVAIAVPGILAFSDLRFAFVAVILAFAVWPMLLAFAWFSLLARPEVATLSRPQRWTYSSGRCRVEFFPFGDHEHGPEEFPPVAAVEFSPGDIAGFSSGGPNVVVKLEAGQNHTVPYLVVPKEYFPPNLEKDIYTLSHE